MIISKLAKIYLTKFNTLLCLKTLSTIIHTLDFLDGSAGEDPPARQETNKGLILGSVRLLWKEMVMQSSILAWEISWTGKPGGLQSMRL